MINRWSTDRSGPLFSCTGGFLSPSKGIEYAIKAWPAVLLSAPQARLVVYGQPHPDIGAAYQRALDALVLSLGLQGSVFFLDARLSAGDLQKLNAAADVAIFAHLDGRQRSSGTMILAMAAGSVPIATPFAQAEELLNAGGAGVLVPFKSTEALAAAVVKLAREKGALEKVRLGRGVH